MLPLCAAPLASESAACDLASKVFRDPHINFAYGGSADLRGRHNALYNFLSAPGLSVNVKTEDAVFEMHRKLGHTLTVHGSFITEVCAQQPALPWRPTHPIALPPQRCTW